MLITRSVEKVLKIWNVKDYIKKQTEASPKVVDKNLEKNSDKSPKKLTKKGTLKFDEHAIENVPEILKIEEDVTCIDL